MRPLLWALRPAVRRNIQPFEDSFIRTFSKGASACDSPNLEPAAASAPDHDAILSSTSHKNGPTSAKRTAPVGSKRRRAAIRTSQDLPFEQLPYQCFQEARKILRADREEKLKQIGIERERIALLKAKDASKCGGEAEKTRRLRSMETYLEELKILADINDPMIKKRFEDGDGDMSKPIYRYLANKQWRSYRRPLLMQRITQMNVTPDIIPRMNPTADVRLAFGRRNVQPGDFVDSRVSEQPGKLRVQVFDKGERRISVAVIDPDVPDLATDRFGYRCHYLAVNIPVSPTSPAVPLSRPSETSQMVMPWLPPYVQKGMPYHRLAVFVLEHPSHHELDASSLKETSRRDGFNLRSFVDKHHLRPIGVGLFRSQWDEGTASIMSRAGIKGAEVEYVRPRVESLKPKPFPRPAKRNRMGFPTKRL
ncbi:MAG: hypothetical protein M1817_005686 [Caeruleum heppii]|nr:MAG: hypothetical protein M1817_005686 [Caeruleum heppii]